MSRKKKKKEPLPPRRLRMNRSGRLQAAPKWLSGFNGKNVIRSYAKWFGVDKLCAIRELQMLGIPLSESKVEAIKKGMAASKRARKRKKAVSSIPDGYDELWDDNFALIVDFTEGGAPIGVSWEEAERFERGESPNRVAATEVSRTDEEDEDFDIPF